MLFPHPSTVMASGFVLFTRCLPRTFNGLANTTATLGSFYWLGFETSGLSPDKKRLAWLGAQRRAHPPLPAGAGWDLGVRVGRTGGHRKSAAGRGWMMRLDRSRVRVGLSALRSRRWGKSAGMASLDAGKVKVQRAKFKGKAGSPIWPSLHRCQERHHPARLLSYPWGICMSGFASRYLLSCFQMRLLLHGLQILGLSMSACASTSEGARRSRGLGWN